MSGPIVNSSVFIVIPFYNENAVIAEVINKILPWDYRVIVVDDGSTISPHEILKNFPGVFLLRHKVNLGQGAALQTGIEYALKQGAEYVVSFDADGQHDADDIAAMLLPLYRENADVTLASRFLEKGLHNASLIKQLVLKIARLINFLFTGLYLTDAHNGLRAMSQRAAQKISIKENGMAHASEILFLIKQNGLKYKEVPARIIYTGYSMKKGQSVFNSIRIFFDLVLHKLFE
ncbi:MAG: glycosyltransferase family 2 protein [Bacteroidetes bacterium]|nr:glycosyltransferase family 2 protein [Bacteroidota bacterium]MBS1929766.1 glycosyltransferase family 2 protein [Bacteroidota bacterium]